MKKYLLLLLIYIFWGFQLPAAYAERPVLILVYHSIAEYKGTGSKELYVTPENFEKKINYLRDNGFTLLTFDRWQDRKKVKKPIFLTFDDGYKNNENVYLIFKKLASPQFQPTGTLFVISDFIGRENRLTSTDLKRLAKSGYFSIQSHTATHVDLTKTKDFTHELRDSKEMIGRITGKPVIALSYPYGNFNEKVVEETKKYYSFGITTTPELFFEKGTKDELYYLPRIYIKYSTTLAEFARIVD